MVSHNQDLFAVMQAGLQASRRVGVEQSPLQARSWVLIGTTYAPVTG